MEENDRKYTHAKETNLEWTPSHKVESSILPIEMTPSATIKEISENEILLLKSTSVEKQPESVDDEALELDNFNSEVILAEEIIHKSIARLNEICNGFRNNYIKDIESQVNLPSCTVEKPAEEKKPRLKRRKTPGKSKKEAEAPKKPKKTLMPNVEPTIQKERYGYSN